MSTAFIAAGLVMIALPGLLRHRLARLQPTTWCRAAGTSARAGLSLVQLGLFSAAAATVLRGAGAHEVAEVCIRLVGAAPPGGAVTGWGAAATLGWVLFARWESRRRVHDITEQARIEPWLGTHERHEGGVDHVTIPTAQLLAYAVPGRAPQVVVSAGLCAGLTSDELAAVIGHEASHLRHRHHRLLALACDLDAIFDHVPALRSTADVLRLAVERVADEDAVAHTSGRHHVRTALIKTATAPTVAQPAFNPAHTILDRITALESPPPQASGPRTVALLAGPTVVAVTATAGWVLATHHLLLGLLKLCLG